MLQKRGKFMSAQNLTLLTDLYELTMIRKTLSVNLL